MDSIIYGICLALGLLFTIFSAVAGHLFGGHHDGGLGTGGHAEAGYSDSGIPGISFFSPTVLASFVTAFGACGLILKSIDTTSPIYISAPASAVAGLVIALLVLWLFNAMFRKTQGSSESRIASLVGMVASIVTPIPENGVGEIAYVQGGTRYTAPARSTDGRPIGAAKAVRIARIVGTQFYVEVTD
jgi:membrane protein implicated in regulation of membrane protease activity